MGYRIVIDMAAAPAAEARLWALVGQRGIEILAASFNRNRLDKSIHATLEVDADLIGARRLMRQLERHHDILRMSLDAGSSTDVKGVGESRPLLPARRLHIPVRRGACV